MFIGKEFGLVSLWDSAAFHAFVVIGADTLSGCISFHGFADWVGFLFVDVFGTDSGFFGVFISSRFWRDNRLASSLWLLRFRRVLLDRWLDGCILLGWFNGFRWLDRLYRQLWVGFGLNIVDKFTDPSSSFLNRWLGFLFEVIICISIIFKIIFPILLSFLLFCWFTLCLNRLNRLWLCFRDCMGRLGWKDFLTVFRLFFVINRFLQRFLKLLLVKLLVIIVLFDSLFVIYLFGLRQC